MVRIDFTGNLTCNCEKRMHNNSEYFYFRVAAQVTREQTEFITCFVSFNIEKLMPHLTTGKSVYISGRPRISVYTYEGETRARYDVNVQELELTSRKGDAQ